MTLTPPKGAKEGLRTLHLDFGNTRREPDAQWPSGTPMTASQVIKPRQGQHLLAILGALSFFEGEYLADAKLQPKDHTAQGVYVQGTALRDGKQHRVSVKWHWNAQTRSRLIRLATQLDGKADAQLRLLANTLPIE